MERGEGRFKQVCYLTCLTVAFPSQAANTLMKIKSSFSKEEATTIPSGSSEHASQSDPSILALAVSPQTMRPKAALQSGVSPLSPSLTPEWRTPGNPGPAKHSTVTVSRK